MIQTQLVIIQPTTFCNIKCRYCYLAHRSLMKRISSRTLSRIFELLFSSSLVAEELTILWHAGEPLTLPIRFYEHAFELQEQWNVRKLSISNSFQTNGTRITQEWCDFFKKYQVQIGISLDGPEHIHNANRVNRSGKGTFDQVMRGVYLLEKMRFPTQSLL